MAPCTHPGMKRLFCQKAKNGLGRFAPSALPHYEEFFLPYMLWYGLGPPSHLTYSKKTASIKRPRSNDGQLTLHSKTTNELYSLFIPLYHRGCGCTIHTRVFTALGDSNRPFHQVTTLHREYKGASPRRSDAGLRLRVYPLWSRMYCSTSIGKSRP